MVKDIFNSGTCFNKSTAINYWRMKIMSKSNRCLYSNNFTNFLLKEKESILGEMLSKYNGNVESTQADAWNGEIDIMKNLLNNFKEDDGQIIFEYDIPRLGKRIDVVLLLRGIIFCLEFKVGKDSPSESDVDQVFDYALDLNNFHKFSEDKTIAPILIATNHKKVTSIIQKSVYSDNVINPLVTG